MWGSMGGWDEPFPTLFPRAGRGGAACPSETKPMDHPSAAHPTVPKGTLAPRHVPPSLPTSFALASVVPSVKWGCCSSLAELDGGSGSAKRLTASLAAPGDPVPKATTLLVRGQGPRGDAPGGCSSPREDSRVNFPLE